MKTYPSAGEGGSVWDRFSYKKVYGSNSSDRKKMKI